MAGAPIFSAATNLRLASEPAALTQSQAVFQPIRVHSRPAGWRAPLPVRPGQADPSGSGKTLVKTVAQDHDRDWEVGSRGTHEAGGLVDVDVVASILGAILTRVFQPDVLDS